MELPKCVVRAVGWMCWLSIAAQGAGTDANNDIVQPQKQKDPATNEEDNEIREGKVKGQIIWRKKCL